MAVVGRQFRRDLECAQEAGRDEVLIALDELAAANSCASETQMIMISAMRRFARWFTGPEEHAGVLRRRVAENLEALQDALQREGISYPPLVGQAQRLAPPSRLYEMAGQTDAAACLLNRRRRRRCANVNRLYRPGCAWRPGSRSSG
jgi:hypothetical protein